MEDNKQLTSVVKSIVDGIFSEKEEADRQRMTEEAITKSTATINDLTNVLEDKKALLSDLESKYNELLASVEDKDSKISTLESEKSSLESSFESTKTELDKIKEDYTKLSVDNEAVVKELSELKEIVAEVERIKVAETRFSDLETSGVAYKDKEKQISKIKMMSDEEFASYKEELLAIKEAIISATPNVPEDNNNTALEDKTVVLANVNSDLKVALASELKTQEDLVKKYEALGKAMAAAMTKDKNV